MPMATDRFAPRSEGTTAESVRPAGARHHSVSTPARRTTNTAADTLGKGDSQQ